MNATGLLLLLLTTQIQRTSSQDGQLNKQLNGETHEGSPLTEAEFASALLLKAELEEASENADVSGRFNTDLFEGDIVNPGLNEQNIHSFVGNEKETEKKGGVFRNAVLSQLRLWPNGRVPYTIDIFFPPYSRLMIAAAITDFNANTCIRFVPKEASDDDYVEFYNGAGCYSYIGHNGGRQPVSLDHRVCADKGTAIHEMMHTIGFYHEQSRADRDDYVKINWQNIPPIYHRQFAKYSLEEITNLGTPYDYGSILHYGKFALTWNGLPTIEPLQAGAKIGQNRGFSENDIIKINRLYNCDVSATTVVEPAFRPCQDKLSNCAFLKAAGHCSLDYSKRFMQSNCPTSCNFCKDDGAAPCVDETPLCASWAASLSCAIPQLKEYMHSKCPAACSLC